MLFVRWTITTLLLLLILTSSIQGGGVNNGREHRDFAEEFPTIQEIQEMSKLSLLVYKFHYQTNVTCDTINSQDSTYDINCHWYLHDTELGTQVLLVSHDVQKYIAIVFAGTDDIRTSVEDANIFTKPFGNNNTITLPFSDNKIRVHAGFNNAVFTNQIWEQIYNHTKILVEQKPKYQLYTTGHSLGAANSILTATAIASLKTQSHDDSSSDSTATYGVSFPPVKCINFGCPQIGNENWKDYFTGTSPLRNNLSIWRVVLAWDLVPRLPELFYHVGHTIQVDGKIDDVRVYYEHYGNATKGYAGAPSGWYSKSYAWFPYALYYHHVHKYVARLNEFNNTFVWPKYFYPVDGTVYDDGKSSMNI
jgi:hypothetical protein